MKHLLFVITLFSAPLFFGVTTFLNIPYEGIESSNLYRNYCIVLFTCTMTFILLDKKRIVRRRTNFIPFSILVLYIYIGYASGYSAHSSFLTLVAFSLPAACIGVYYAIDSKNSLFKIVKWLDVLFAVLSVGVLSLSVRLYSDMTSNEHNYSQQLSYYAALCFMLDVFLLIYGRRFNTNSFFRKRFVRLAYYCLLPVFVVVIFFSGGRGGFVTLIVGTFSIVFLYHKVNWRGWIWGAIAIVLVSVFISQIEKSGSEEFSEHLNQNRQRVLSYIQFDDDEEDVGQTGVRTVSINMQETSGRDMVYRNSWNMFLKRPITGYGIFRYKRILQYNYGQPYPHNLFLEWLLQGGIFFFLAWFYVLIKWVVRLHRIIKNDNRYVVLLPFFVYAFVQLMFSGSYMGMSFFWFTLSFAFNKRLTYRPIQKRIPSLPAR